MLLEVLTGSGTFMEKLLRKNFHESAQAFRPIRGAVPFRVRIRMGKARYGKPIQF